MKTNKFLGLILIVAFLAAPCNAQSNKKPITGKSVSKIEVYYFHFTQRCVTCHAVEDNARKSVESLYPEKVKSGEYRFQSLNLDDSSTKAIADKLGIGGQTLLLVYGNKKIDLTSKGFLYAHDYEKIKEEIKKTVDKILKG